MHDGAMSSDPELQISPVRPKKRGRPRKNSQPAADTRLRTHSAIERPSTASDGTIENRNDDDGAVLRSKSVTSRRKVVIDASDEESEGEPLRETDIDNEGRGSSKLMKRKTPANFKMMSDVEEEAGTAAASQPKRLATGLRRGRSAKALDNPNDAEPNATANDVVVASTEHFADTLQPPKAKAKSSNAKKGKADAKKKAPEKRRRRIKTLAELEAETRKARREETERQKRIRDHQKTYSMSDLAKNLPTEDSVVVLEKDRATGKALLQLNPTMARKLKTHQIEGVQFMWTNVCESLERLKNPEVPGSGCILAHCMGLGKTLSVISFVHSLIFNHEVTGVKTCLILAPLNTVLNWVAEFRRWVPEDSAVDVYEISSLKENKERAIEIESWYNNGGVLILGYEMYRRLAQLRVFNPRSKTAILRSALLSPGADIVVCDEGHILKSSDSAISKILNEIRTRRRIVLTGTPLQNNLFEYHCMVSFVKPNFLGTRKEFANLFATPIRNGETIDASPHDVMMMKKRTSVLFRLLAPCVHRRGYEHLATALPPKYEYAVFVGLSPLQCELYSKYLREIVGVLPSSPDLGLSERDAQSFRRRLLVDFHTLQYISAHPCLLFAAYEREVERETKREFLREIEEESDEVEVSLADDDDDDVFLDKDSDDSDEVTVTSQSLSANEDEDEDEDEDEEREGQNDETYRPNTAVSRQSVTEERPRSGRRPVTRNSSRQTDSAVVMEEVVDESPMASAWFSSLLTEDMVHNVDISTKFMIMLYLIRSFEKRGEKTLVFSQSLIFLNLFQVALEEEQKRRTAGDSELGGLIPTWEPGSDYFRIDGQIKASDRVELMSRFNNPEDRRARLFLISTRAGGLGVNLVGANRVILTDSSWNPAHDVQAIFRAYRFGQTKPVFVYRLIAAGTMEERIYDRQVLKQSLSQRVVDEQQIMRHFSADDIAELYRFTFHETLLDDTPADVSNVSASSSEFSTSAALSRFIVPKDHVLADLLRKMPHFIKKYHDHDSLLAHQASEVLDEAEQLAAWREYELEQRGIRVDLRDPAWLHRQLSWALQRSRIIEQCDADVEALKELRDLFGELRPAVHEYVENFLPQFEAKAVEIKKQKQEAGRVVNHQSNENNNNNNMELIKSEDSSSKFPSIGDGFGKQLMLPMSFRRNRPAKPPRRRSNAWYLKADPSHGDLTSEGGSTAHECVSAENHVAAMATDSNSPPLPENDPYARMRVYARKNDTTSDDSSDADI